MRCSAFTISSTDPRWLEARARQLRPGHGRHRATAPVAAAGDVPLRCLSPSDSYSAGLGADPLVALDQPHAQRLGPLEVVIAARLEGVCPHCGVFREQPRKLERAMVAAVRCRWRSCGMTSRARPPATCRLR